MCLVCTIRLGGNTGILLKSMRRRALCLDRSRSASSASCSCCFRGSLRSSLNPVVPKAAALPDVRSCVTVISASAATRRSPSGFTTCGRQGQPPAALETGPGGRQEGGSGHARCGLDQRHRGCRPPAVCPGVGDRIPPDITPIWHKGAAPGGRGGQSRVGAVLIRRSPLLEMAAAIAIPLCPRAFQIGLLGIFPACGLSQ